MLRDLCKFILNLLDVICEVLRHNLLSYDLIFGFNIFIVNVSFCGSAQFEVSLGVFLIDECNVSVYRLLVKLLNLQFSFFVYWLKNILFVVLLRLRLDLLEDLWILWKHSIMKESLGQTESFAFFVISDIDKLCFALVDNVMITD